MAEEFNTEGMLDMYLFENEQLLEQLQDMVLDQKDAECFDDDSINEIFRTMHTIKGSSGIMMFDNITAVSHKLEDVFYYLRESKPDNVPHLELVEHVLSVADFITGEMDKIRNGDEVDGDATDILEELDKFLNAIQSDGSGEDQKSEKPIPQNVHEEPKQFYIAPVATSASRFYKIYLSFYPDTEMSNVHAYKIVYALKEVAEDLLYSPEDIISDESSAEVILEEGFRILLQAQCSEEDLRELINVGYAIEKVDIFECKAEEFLQGFDFGGDDLAIDLDSSVEEIETRAQETQESGDEKEEDKKEEKPQKPAKPQVAPGDYVIKSKEPGRQKKLARDKPKAEKSFISVNVSKMDQLMDLIGELVISESVVLQNPDLKVPGLNLDSFYKAASQLSKISTDLQNVIMSMRMVPLTNTFQKMNRIVFDVSRKLGKDIEFEMVGEHTEVDKNIIEHISDPLMHMVRNAVDHGIESNEERLASGKTEKGKVTLSAKTEAGKVWISVEDNGRGLDREKILAKAKKQGLLEEGKPESAYSDKEVYQFITMAGFSTNEQVTEYSGRGVGMDVVVQNLQDVSGVLDIESTKGSGSIMSLKIPLTLAIINGIVVETGGASFVVEIGVIKEFVRVKEEMMIHEPNGEEYIMIRGECFPVLRLGEWYGMETSNYRQSVEDGMMLIIEIEDRKICLLVDRLIGEQEIVVKPIPSYVKKVKGLSGCTQLGDGSIALILDPAGLM